MTKYILIFLAFFRLFVASQSTDPCQTLSEAYKSDLSKKQFPYFPPSEVLACLRTVPVNQTLSVAQIQWYRNFIEFQSTLSYLQNPPSGYELPAINILGGLDAIQSNIESGRYESTFDIESDLTNLVAAAYDGHFTVKTQLSNTQFTGFRNVQLVSISSDGTSLPKVYFIDDLSEPNASDLVSIDGVEVTEAVQKDAFAFQNLDALYNSMFFSLPGALLGAGFYNQSQSFIQNDNTVYQFRNGSQTTISNAVLVLLELDNITSGQDLYDQFLIQPTATASSSASQTTAAASSTVASSTASASSTNPLTAAEVVFPQSGYPIPMFVNSDFIISGYFLPNSTDTCVLSTYAFEDPSENPADSPVGANATAFGLGFQNVTKSLIAACKADNRTKLLIDVRSNIGGTVYFAYDLFRQLFPSRLPFSATRFRAHPATNLLGEIISTLGGFPIGDDNIPVQEQATPFNFNNTLSSPSETPFQSWQGLYGPDTLYNDNFTNLLSWKFSDIALDFVLSGIVPTGFANSTQPTEQPFADEDITLITDAQCSSTCSTFVNLLLSQTNVSTIAFGGKPSRDPMAVIGGVEGAEIFFYSIIAAVAEVAVGLLEDNSTSAAASVNLSTTKEKALQVLKPLTQDPPLQIAGGLASQSVNFMNAFPQNDPTSMVPFQFLPPITADCRVFYLKEDILNVTNTWQRVAKGDFVCVDGGSLGQKRNGTSNPVQPFVSAAATVQTDAPFAMLVSLLMGLVVLMV